MKSDQERLFRMNAIRRLIIDTLNQGKDIDKNKLVATCSLKYGITPVKIKEYINTIITADDLDEFDGIITRRVN